MKTLKIGHDNGLSDGGYKLTLTKKEDGTVTMRASKFLQKHFHFNACTEFETEEELLKNLYLAWYDIGFDHLPDAVDLKSTNFFSATAWASFEQELDARGLEWS